jgi:hypothetical protein
LNVNAFAEQLGREEGVEFYITNSWYNKSKPHESHHSHMHPNSIFSAVLYVDGPDCPTFFYNNGAFANFTIYDKNKDKIHLLTFLSTPVYSNLDDGIN